MLGAAPDHPMSLHRAKHAAEQELLTSGMQWTIIRPATFLETWIAIIGAKIPGSGQALVLGPGRNPINFVSAHDVTAIIDIAARGESLRDQAIEAAAGVGTAQPTGRQGRPSRRMVSVSHGRMDGEIRTSSRSLSAVWWLRE